MKDKKFKWISQLLGFFFALIGVMMLFAAIGSVMSYFFESFLDSVIVEVVPEQTQAIINTSPRLTELSRAADYLVIALLYLILVGYSAFKGGNLFNQLSKGSTPFTVDFSRMLKRISYLLILADFIGPLAYTILLSFSKETGSHFFIDLTYLTLIGLMLYVFSVILDYGISLQEFSDQVV